MATYRQMVIETALEWNLLGPSGAPAPLTPASIAELDFDTIKTIAEKADALVENNGSLPNDSGAPSAASSQESASPTPKRTRKPTT